MAQSILIPAHAFESVTRRLGRLAKKAGVSIDMVTGSTRVYRLAKVARRHANGQPVRDDRGDVCFTLKVDTTQALECNRVTIGDMPATNGYTLIGKVSHIPLADGGTGNTLSLAPGARETDVDPSWLTGKPTCDHCNTTRPRKDTFLVRQPDGKIVRIGRNCLADFLMCDPTAMIALSEFQDSLRECATRDLDDGEFWGNGSGWEPSPFWFLACAVATVDKLGFVSREMSDNTGRESTATTVNQVARPFKGFGLNIEKQRAEWQALQPTPEHEATAVAITQWLADSSDSSAYIHNLKIALSAAVADRRITGLLASAPTAYARAMGQLKTAAERAARPDAGHLGAVGARIDFEATVVAVKAIDSLYGVKHVISFRSAEGHDCVTFSTSKGPRTSDVGAKFNVRGTVKEHGQYQGRAQTVFSRCAWEIKVD